MNNQPTIALQPATTALSDTDPSADSGAEAVPEQLAEETLVEEVSIDGMCGVY